MPKRAIQCKEATQIRAFFFLLPVKKWKFGQKLKWFEMALYDNSVWILSHIRTSFNVSDDTGNSELVLNGVPKKQLIPVAERDGITEFVPKVNNEEEVDDDDEEVLSKSFEIRLGRNPIGYRPRCNTEIKLEKLRNDRTTAPRVKTISWKAEFSDLKEDQSYLEQLFPKKPPGEHKRTSLLSRQLQLEPEQPANPFIEYSQCHADHEGQTIKVFLSGLSGCETETEEEEEKKNYLIGHVIENTLVKDVIGYVCWKYTKEARVPALKPNVSSYALYLAESDGTVEWDLRAVEKLEPISRFGLTEFSLVDLDNVETENSLISSSSLSQDIKVVLPDGTFTIIPVLSRHNLTVQNLIDQVMASRHKAVKSRPGISHNFYLESKDGPGKPLDPSLNLGSIDESEFFIVRENSRRCREFESGEEQHGGSRQLNAVDAATYKEYGNGDVYLVTKIKTKIPVNLAVSQDKFDVFPSSGSSSSAARFWKHHHQSVNMDEVAACDVTEKKANGRWVFRLVFRHESEDSFKKIYMEASQEVVEEVQQKICHLLNWHSSKARSDYIVHKEIKWKRRHGKTQ